MSTQPEQNDEPYCRRYVLEPPERPGGMSIVIKAYDMKSKCHVAIKRMRRNANTVRQKDSFSREYEALKSLVHPNIVKMLDVGIDDNRDSYLVLEWVEQNLDEYINAEGPLDWTQFYERVGRPILDAIVFAQGQRWVHRDIKPKNILMGIDLIPKIADYGIAKHLIGPTLHVEGNTFNFDRTAGFSPKESSSGAQQYNRDCFSFAAVAAFCLSGHKILTDEDVHVAMQLANVPASIKTILEKCLSDYPKERPQAAGVLLSELDTEHDKLAQRAYNKKKCSLFVKSNVVDKLIRILNLSDRKGVEDFISKELSEVNGVSLNTMGDQVSPSDVCVNIYGVTWTFEAKLAGFKKEYLEIDSAHDVQFSECALKRDKCLELPLQFSFEKPANPNESASQLQDIIAKLSTFAREVAALQAQERDRELFQLWKAILKDREELETAREKAIVFRECRLKEGNIAVLTTDDYLSPEMLDEERTVALGKEIIFGVIKEINGEQIEFRVTSGDASKIPQNGKLLVNTVRERKAIEYQSQALDSLIYDRAVNPRLKEILIDPSKAKTPVAVNDYVPSDRNLDEEKVEIVQKALGDFEMLAIEGPPGTGKTKLITEIITQKIRRNPETRILLSSQTHIALDNVLEQVVQLLPDAQVLRIGRDDQQKISPKMRNHLVSEMAEKWASKVKEKSYSAFSQWAEKVGVDKSAIQVGMKVEALIKVLENKNSSLKLMEELEKQNEENLKEEEKIKATEGKSAFDDIQDETQDSIAELKGEIRKWKSLESDLRADLKLLGGYAQALAENDNVDDLREWQKVFLTDDQLATDCKNRLSLHEDWVLRVGKSQDFYPLLLKGAQVVGGTCVGLASIKGNLQVQYDLCIIDEASKATPPEILIPLTRSKRWIVVGDPKQLPPFFEQIGDKLLQRYSESEIKGTVLDRLVQSQNGLPEQCQRILKNQYRMITPIGNLISNCFYGGKLHSPIAKHELVLSPSFSHTVTWYSTVNSNERSERKTKGSTFENPVEGVIILNMLDRLQFQAKAKKVKISVAVIAGYLGQVGHLTNIITKRKSTYENLQIDINSVDAFQGRQADVCIYSVTRSNNRGALGFLREKPRLNVALSRGRSALIIVGDHLFCKEASGENPYKDVLSEIETNSINYLLEPYVFGDSNG